MYQASKNFGDAIAGPNRKFNTRLLENGKVLVESVKSFTKTSGAEEITIGSAVASYIQATIENKGISLSGKEVSLEIGVEVDGEMEYIPMGLYTIQNPKIESNKVTFTAYDPLANKCNAAYYSKLEYPVDALDILDEISNMTGVPIDTSTLQRGIQIDQRTIIEEGDYDEVAEEDTIIMSFVNPFNGYTYKETIGFIAGLFGKFAACGRTGEIEFRWYNDISYEIPSNIFYNDLQETEESFDIERLTCVNADQTLSSGTGATGISMQNPVMTQDNLDNVFSKVKGLTYTPAVLRFIGDMRLDIGDIVTAVKNDGTKFKIPIISLITSFDGGLMQTVASYGNTAEEDDSDTKGPLTEMAERVEYELAFVKKLMVDNLVATNATIKNLSGDILDFKTGDFENLKSDVANFKTATADNLNATNAKITYIEANYIQTKDIEAKVGTFGYLKADDLSAKVADLGYLKVTTADATYATITNLDAATAKISNLEADQATFKEATADNLNAANARIINIEADYLKATDAQLTYATITNLNATNAAIEKLQTKDAEIDKLVATKASITDLNAAVGRVGVLESGYADLNTLVNGNLTSDNIQNLTLTSKNTTIENGMIKNAMIENLSFDKITGIDINTTNLTVHSSDGKSKWSDNTIQISDTNRVRVQIGKDASNDYSMSVWDKSGKLIWDALGATENTIQRKIIRDSVVADDANISGSKLDINSVIKEVNGSTTKLKSSTIVMNDQNQTLDVIFNEMETTVADNLTSAKLYADGKLSDAQKYALEQANSALSSAKNYADSAVNGLEIGGRNLVLDSKPQKQGSSYSVVSRHLSVDVQAGVTYTISFCGRVVDGDGSLVVYLYRNDWKCSTQKSTKSKEDTIISWQFTPTIGGTFKIEAYSFLSQGVAGGNIYLDWFKVEKGNKATDYTPAPEDTQSQIDSITEITTSHTTSISTMQGQISSLISEDTTIKGNYDALLSRYNATVATVDSMKTTIGEHTTILNSQNDSIAAISTKANTIESNLEGTTRTVSEVKSNLEGTQERVTKVETSLTGLTTRVSSTETNLANLEIGGRNLLTKDDCNMSKWTNAKPDWTHVTNSEYSNTLSYSTLGSGWETLCKLINVTKGQKYTLSFDYKVNKAYNYYGNYRYGVYVSTSYQGSAPPSNVIENGQYIIENTVTDIKRGSITFVAPAETLYIAINGGCIADGQTGLTFEFNKWKLEKGNKPTDWTQAPEDIDQQITAAETIASQTANKFNWLVKSGTNSTDFELTDRTATLVANAINLNGLVTFSGLSSDAKNEIDKVAQSKVNSLDIGGRNLLLNSKTNIYRTGKETDADGFVEGYHIGTGGWNEQYYKLSIINDDTIKYDKPITISAYVKAPSGDALKGAFFCLDLRDSGNVRIADHNYALSDFKNHELINEDTWTYVSITASDLGDAFLQNGKWDLQIKTNGAFPTGSKFWYKKVKVEFGTKPTDWTPAPKDVEADATTKASSAETNAKNYSNNAVEWVTNNGSSTTSLNSMVKKWTDGAVSDTTQINGGWIKANTITANKIALADFTNYSQLTRDTADMYGFTVTDDTNGTWFVTKTIKRDMFISKLFPCNGGESYLIEYDISTNMKASDTASDTKKYRDTAIGVYGYTGDTNSNGEPAKATNIWYATRVTGTSDTPVTHIKTAITTSTATKQFRIFLQSNGYYFEGTTKIRNLSVRRMYGGTLIVDGSITADKIAAGTITANSGIIADAAITNAKIQSIDATKITTGQLSADRIDVTGIFAKDITATGIITGVNLVGATGTFSGNVTATEGKIGRYDITSTYLMTNSGSNASGIGGIAAFWAGSEDSSSAPFRVGYDGSLVAENATIYGNIRTGNIGDSGDTAYLNDGHLTIQGTANDTNIYSTWFKFGIGGDYYLKSVSDGVECYRNFYTTDVYVNGWTYAAMGSHYTWQGQWEAYISCGNYSGGNNIYYYANYHAFYVTGDSDSGMMYIETSGVSSRKGFRNSSDERIKKDFRTFDDDFIKSYMQLEPIKYRFKDDTDNSYHIGFKAQNVNGVLNNYGKSRNEQFGICATHHIDPEYAEKAYGEKGMTEVYTLAYDELIGANTFMIQKTRKDLMYQAGKIDMQEAIINDLQTRLLQAEKTIKQNQKQIEQLSQALA